MNTPTTPDETSFTGCLLGLALGDALGAPHEGKPPGMHIPDCSSTLTYTDDTEMMINLARAILECTTLSRQEIVRYFASNYNPARGYGGGTLKVLSLVKDGLQVDVAVRSVFPEGSYGNGAAMRVAPVGLAFYRDEELLEHAIRESALATHVHPVGVDGARMMALSVAFVLRGRPVEELTEYLSKKAQTPEFKKALDRLKITISGNPSPKELIEILGNSVASDRSVPTAIYAFLKHGRDFMKTISFCLSLGGDTDTIAAMAGALSGCLVKEEGLPGECLKRLEDRSKISSLAKGLYLTAQS